MILNSLMVISHLWLRYHFAIIDGCLSVGLILASPLDDRRCQMVMLMPPSAKE